MAGIESIWRAVERLQCEVLELQDLVAAHREVVTATAGEDASEPAWLRVFARRVASLERAGNRVEGRVWPLTTRGIAAREELARIEMRRRPR